MKYFVTGTAGFIGFHTAQYMLENGHEVLGYDNINDYYDQRVKHERLDILSKYDKYQFVKGDLEDNELLTKTWDSFEPESVLHLAAQAGVRYSIDNPQTYIDCNIIGFQNMIELARHRKPQNFVYASSSSVYGGNKEMPFKESQDVSSPISFYAATKKSNELVAYTYSHLFGLPTTGLRFFTVYGAMSRPDMAMFKFAELMRHGKPIDVYNHGEMVRDFTYVDDIVSGIMGSLDNPMMGQVYNLGKGSPEKLLDMIEYLEEELEIKAEKNFMDIQPGDVPMTVADVSKAKELIGYEPKTSLREGMRHFGKWYRETRLGK